MSWSAAFADFRRCFRWSSTSSRVSFNSCATEDIVRGCLSISAICWRIVMLLYCNRPGRQYAPACELTLAIALVGDVEAGDARREELRRRQERADEGNRLRRIPVDA